MALSKFCTTLTSAVFLLAAACGQADPEGTAGADGQVQNAASAQAANGEATSSGTVSLWRNGAKIPLDLQVAHPNGVVLQLTSLQSRETETVVGVRVINGDDREVDLNRFNNRDGYIVVESGERLYLSPPSVNTSLAVQPGQTLEGELVFLGRLPATQNAVLVLNENSSVDSEHTRVPGFRIDLPLADVASAEAAG